MNNAHLGAEAVRDFVREKYLSRGEWGAQLPKPGLDPVIGSRADYYNTIAFHHTERPQNESIISLQKTFLDNPRFSDIGYHFVIGVDGAVYEGRSLDYEGAHIEKNNTGKIGIAITGNFEHNRARKRPKGCQILPVRPTQPSD